MKRRKQIPNMLQAYIRNKIDRRIKASVSRKIWILVSTPIVLQLCYGLMMKVKEHGI
jgi:hypothetical protein